MAILKKILYYQSDKEDQEKLDWFIYKSHPSADPILIKM